MNPLRKLGKRLVIWMFKPIVQHIIDCEIRVVGDRRRLRISPFASMSNARFNLMSGTIEIGDHSFAGHDVSFITGTHDHLLMLKDRLGTIPSNGRDIIVGRGVWICSGAIVLGPCTIGDHAVIAAGAVVLPGTVIPYGTVFAGVPAKLVKLLELSSYNRRTGK